jgi:ABC-type uncharacterized transport system permease subunit
MTPEGVLNPSIQSVADLSNGIAVKVINVGEVSLGEIVYKKRRHGR